MEPVGHPEVLHHPLIPGLGHKENAGDQRKGNQYCCDPKNNACSFNAHDFFLEQPIYRFFLILFFPPVIGLFA
jgi:hypothetical protein